MVADIVFRRLGASPESACRLLGDGGFRSPRLTPADEWCGLWSLTAAGGGALVAVAAVARPVERFLEVRALAAPAGRLRARLIQELTDTCRAGGAEWLIAAASITDRTAREQLPDFTDPPPSDLPHSPTFTWLAREV